MTTPFVPNFDPLAQQRRIMKMIKPADPLASYRRSIEQTKAFDPAARQRKMIEQITEATGPKLPDLLATQRRLSAQIQSSLRPPDPLAEYRRVVDRFSVLTGSAIADTATSRSDSSAPAESGALPLPSRTMALHMLAIAWFCYCLLAEGASVGLFGDLMIEAINLADHYSSAD